MILFTKDISPLERVKSIVFDVDGVLVDVSQSFRKMIIFATDYYFRLKFGVKGRSHLLTFSIVERFKRIGGFNNDWDLTSMAVFIYLNLYFKNGRPETLENLKIPEDDFLKILNNLHKKTRLPGFESLYSEATKYFNEPRATENFDREMVEELCKVLYAGERTEEVYGKPLNKNNLIPSRLKKFNLYRKEKTLLNEKFLPNGVSFGLVTGRTPGELSLLKERFPLLFRRCVKITTDDGVEPKKPDPLVLRYYLENGYTPLLFVGDSRDDLETVNNVRKYFNKDDTYFAAVVKDRSGFEFFRSLDADLITTDVNILLLAVSNN
ncbi:MAG: HAD family hydrolase [Actinobacteria bacterium]|nr:HAD family hydrolase [Actinomycetota bacterium]